MGTRKVKLKGLGYWAKVFEDNRDETGYENALADIGGQTTIDVDLDDDMMEKLKESKSMKKGKESEDNPGLTRVKFTRKWTEKYGGGEPKVVHADGTPWDYDEDGPIGNGSVVEVVLSVYDTSRKAIVGTRLEKVKVVEHIPYVPDDDDDEDEPAPKPAAKSTKSTNKKKAEELPEDEIPFD